MVRMVRGGKFTSKSNLRKRVQSKEGGSNDSDEDYVFSGDGGDVSDCPEGDCFSLDGCTSEDSFDGFIEEDDDEEEEEEEEEEQVQRVRKFNRSRAKSGIRHQQKNASKSSWKRGRTTYAEQSEEEEDLEEEEQQQQQEEVDGDDDYDDDDDDEEEEEEEEEEDSNYEDDEEFTPEEEDCSDEEDEIRGTKKKNNGMKISKKPLRRRVSVTSKRKRSRVSKKPLRKRRRKIGGSRGKVCDDFIDNGPPIGEGARVRRRLILEDSNSDSDCVSKPFDCEFTISEEEREQVREAMKLCGSFTRNSRSVSLRKKNGEVAVHDSLRQQLKPQVRKGKEKIEESQGGKGKEKIEDVKSEVVKQVCGVCLSEENKRRVRGVLNCCTHYFCFACIMEWSKVESRCPLCKKRFKTISKSTRPTTAIGLREVVIQVPERNQVYQPTEEELRSYIDPYESVICSECHQGGDDGLMLLCDVCDSPAHTYCVGLGREVPEGNWYCDGCRPVALASSNSNVQEYVTDSRVPTRNLPARPPSPLPHIQEIIDLNLNSSPRSSFSQGFGHLSSSRFSNRSVEGASPISGGGAPTLSQRRWIHRHIQHMLSTDRMTSTAGRTNGVSATNSMSNFSSQIDQSREPAAKNTTTQDVGTSYHTFFEERLCDNFSPLMQNSIRISSSRRPEVQGSTMFANRPMNGVMWPEVLGTPTLSNLEPINQFSSRSNIVTDGSLSPAIKEESNFLMVKEQLQSMVKSHLESLSRDIGLGYGMFEEIVISSMHTILAAYGLEHKKSEVCNVPPPSVCRHMAGGQASMIKGCCSSCFDSFVGDVVQRVLDTRMASQWLRLAL